MMMVLHDLVDEVFHTKELKEIEIKRLQARNIKSEKEWEKQLHEAINISKKNEKPAGRETT